MHNGYLCVHVLRETGHLPRSNSSVNTGYVYQLQWNTQLVNMLVLLVTVQQGHGKRRKTADSQRAGPMLI